MKRIQVESKIGKTENIQDILKNEVEAATKMKEDGYLEHVYSKSDHSGAILVFKDIDLPKVKELVTTFPLYKYLTNVQYTEMEMIF